MVLQILPSTCPCCEELTESLKFWRKLNQAYFHLCSECCKKEKFTEDELLKIGFHYGKMHTIAEVDVFVKDLK